MSGRELPPAMRPLRGAVDVILDLIEGICLLALVVAGYAAIRRQATMPDWARHTAIGVTFGLGAILAMVMTITVAPGVIIDGRTVLASLAAVFGGVPGAVAAGTLAGGYRLWLGGAGAVSGTVGILGSCVAGLAFSWILRRYRLQRSLLAFWLLGLAVVAQSVLTFFVLDWSIASALLGTAVVPLCVTIPVGTATLGWALHREDRWAVLQRELGEQAELLKTIVDSMSDGVTVVNDRCEIVLTNPASEKLAGVRPNSVPPERWAESFGVYKADGVTPFPHEEMPLMRAVKGEATDEIEMIVENEHSGRRRLLSVSGRPLAGPDGIRRGGVVVFRDVTEHKAMEDALLNSERRLRDAIHSFNEGFVLFDHELRYVVFNQRLLDMYPASAPAVHVGARLEDVLRYGAEHGEYAGIATPDDVETFVRRWMEQLTQRESLHTEGKFADGRWVLVSHHRTSDGGYVSVRTDITQQKQREEELSKAYARLKQQAAEVKVLAEKLTREKQRADEASRVKSQFLANISHELRTPLNAILGFTDVMRLGIFGPLEPARYREYVELIHTSGGHLLSLINDILDIAKIEAGKMELLIADLPPAELARECIALVSGLAQAANLDLRSTVAEGAPRVHADERAVKQIIVNLLSNAIKFTPAGGRIRLSIGRGERGGADIAVSDTGIGMTRTEIEKALRPFEQVAVGYARDARGTGLGLSLCRSLAELHGGSLKVISEKDHGTTVIVHLPDAQEPALTPRLAGSG